MSIETKDNIVGTWEYAIPILASISLLTACIVVSSKKFFWTDELLSYFLLADQSFVHMMHAFSDKINNSPPLYFIFGWIWAKLFGSSEVSLRLFSSFGMCIALVATWITFRRTFNFWASTIGILSVFCASHIILDQNSEARMYGLFMVVCSLGLFQFDLINRAKTLTWRIIALNAFINATMVLTHVFGIIYSGAILAAFIIRDIYFKTPRLKVYFSILCSWLILIPFLPVIINQADAGYPRFWIAPPTVDNLIDVFTDLSPFNDVKFVLIVLILIPLLKYFSNLKERNNSDDTKKYNHAPNAQLSLLVFAYAYLTVPPLVWIVSKMVRPIFLWRYMIPTTLGWAILIAYLSSYIINTFNKLNNSIFSKIKLMRTILAMILLFFLIIFSAKLITIPIFDAINYAGWVTPGSEDKKFGYGELPIVVQFSHDFITRFHYSPERNRYYFILDWEAASSNESGLFAPQEYKQMEAFKRSYPKVFYHNIVQSEEFLKTFDRFLVLDYSEYDKKCTNNDFHCPQWLEKRILNNPNFKISILGEIDDKTLLLVEHKS